MKFTNRNETLSPAENYLNYLDSIFQQEPEYHRNDSLMKEIPGVTSIIYQDIPEKGFTTGLTYGLSIVEHPQWKLSRPELCITVESNEKSWADVAGFIANNLRGKCPFCYGEIINFGEQISEDSEMDAFSFLHQVYWTILIILKLISAQVMNLVLPDFIPYIQAK